MPLKLKRRGRIWWMRGTVAGKRIYESTRTDCEKTAQQIAAQTEAERWKRHLYGAEQTVTMSQAILTYLEAGGEDRYIDPILAEWKTRSLTSIRPGNIRDLAKKLYPGAGPATWNRQVVTPVLAVINCAADRGMAKPVKMKRYPEPKAQRQAIDRDWLEAFRANACNPYLKALALFMFTTGARISECTDMTPDQIDLRRRVAIVPTTKNGDPHEYHLTMEMVVALANLPPRRGRVFGYKSRHSVYGPWRTACSKAEIEYVPPHQSGRHSFATEMITKAGVDVATVAKLGNWRSHRLLLDTYTHPIGGKAAVDEHFAPHKGAPVVQSKSDKKGS